jgi:hypothetical protein
MVWIGEMLVEGLARGITGSNDAIKAAESMGLAINDAMSKVAGGVKGTTPVEFDIAGSSNIKNAFLGNMKAGAIQILQHTGVIRVEGVNDSGDLTGVVDIVIDRLRQEVRI